MMLADGSVSEYRELEAAKLGDYMLRLELHAKKLEAQQEQVQRYKAATSRAPRKGR